MMMMKKTVLTLLAVLAALLPFAGCKKEKAGSNEIRVLTNVTGGKTEAENLLFQQELEKATGLKIVFEKVPASYEDVLMQKLGAGEVYDLIYLNQFQMYNFANQGIIQDLTSRFEKSAIIRENYPQKELDMIRHNGKYYAGFNKQEVFHLPMINKAITDKAGVDISAMTTLDDYYAMMKTVKNYMETVEGKKPFYPLFIYMRDIFDLQPWFSSVGELRRGVFKDSSGKRYAPYASAEARPVWEWLAKLYKEGLLDPASFTAQTTNDMRSRMWQSREIVIDSDWAAWCGLYNNNAKTAGTYPAEVNVVALPGVLSPKGQYILEQGQASMWAIPVNAGNPDGAFKLLEYFATKEGGLLLSAGIQGHDYHIQDGKLVFTEEGKTHAKDHGAPFPISSRFDISILGGLNPGVEEAMAIAKRPDVNISILGFNSGALNTRTFYDIMSKWMSDCFMGRLGAEAAIQGAQDELRGKGMID